MINGKDILVYVEKDGIYYATACDKSATLSILSEFLEITDPNGDGSRRRLPTITDWTLSGNGLVDYHRLISGLYMQQTILARTRIQVKFYANAGDGYVIYQGFGYFQQIDETAAVGEAASYSYTIVADGGLTIISTVPQDGGEGKIVNVLATNDGRAISTPDGKLITA